MYLLVYGENNRKIDQVGIWNGYESFSKEEINGCPLPIVSWKSQQTFYFPKTCKARIFIIFYFIDSFIFRL